MAKLFCEQAHFKHAQSAGGFVGPQSVHRETRLGRPRRVEASFKNVSSSTHMRGAAAPVSSGTRLSQRRGHGCQRNNQAAHAMLARFSGYFPEGGRPLQKPLQARMSAHFGSHSVVCNRRKLRSTIPERLPRVRIATRCVNGEDEAKRM